MSTVVRKGSKTRAIIGLLFGTSLALVSAYMMLVGLEGIVYCLYPSDSRQLLTPAAWLARVVRTVQPPATRAPLLASGWLARS